MRRVSRLMREYFEDHTPAIAPRFLLTETHAVPIIPDVIKWKIVTDPERFMRRFEFETRDRLVDFLGEILELENEMQHNGKITVDHLRIDIEVYTKTVDCVTELDIEYTKAIDQIYEDVMHYGYPIPG